MSTDDIFITVYRTSDDVEAHAICSLLDSWEIEARVVGESQRIWGSLPRSPLEVVVRRADVEQAKEIIAAHNEMREQDRVSLTARPLRFRVRTLLTVTAVVAVVAAVFHWIPFAWWYVAGATLWLVLELAGILCGTYRGVGRAFKLEGRDD